MDHPWLSSQKGGFSLFGRQNEKSGKFVIINNQNTARRSSVHPLLAVAVKVFAPRYQRFIEVFFAVPFFFRSTVYKEYMISWSMTPIWALTLRGRMAEPSMWRRRVSPSNFSSTWNVVKKWLPLPSILFSP